MHSTLSQWVMAAGLLFAAGCATYEPQPLEPERILAAVEAIRLAPDGEGRTDEAAVTLTTLARWMGEHGPSVREAIAAYETALSRARIPTPLPNPTLEVGPQWGFGSDVGSTNEVLPFGSIGFSIPTGGRLAREDEWNRAMAEVARVDALATHRELYLELRARYSALVLAQATESLRERISEAARRTVSVASQLVEAGSAAAIDVALFELEHYRSLSRQLGAKTTSAAEAAELSELVGVNTGSFLPLADAPLPDLPNIPTSADLKALLVAHHPELGRLRARYEAAERALRLEIARQYPDLQIGPTAEGEPGENKGFLGLTLGIEIPLFDRNQQNIAQATQRRAEARVRYEAAANRALASLEGAFRLAELASERHALLENEILPRADASIRIARESLEAGSADALQLLDAERSRREIQIELIESELVERAAWSALEQATGYPLLTLPSETPDRTPPIPQGLEPPPAEGEMATHEEASR